MILIFIAAAVLIVLGVWSIYTNSFSLSVKNAGVCSTTLALVSILGLVGAVVSIVACNIFAGSAKENFAIETFNSFAVIYSAYIGIGFAVTLLSSVLKTKMRAVIVVVIPLWAMIGLFITFMGAFWISFSDWITSMYASVFGICAAAVLAFPPFLEIKGRVRILSDEKLRSQIIKKREDKKEKRRNAKSKKKRLAEKKKRLKNPNR